MASEVSVSIFQSRWCQTLSLPWRAVASVAVRCLVLELPGGMKCTLVACGWSPTAVSIRVRSKWPLVVGAFCSFWSLKSVRFMAFWSEFEWILNEFYGRSTTGLVESQLSRWAVGPQVAIFSCGATLLSSLARCSEQVAVNIGQARATGPCVPSVRV